MTIIKEFESLAHATEEVEDDPTMGIGTRVLVRGTPYVLDAFAGNGPTWRPVSRQPAALEPPGPPDEAPACRARSLPDDSAARKAIPLAEGVLFYAPAALVEVARVSKIGNDKHNPGQPLHHARGKSTDHADCQLRHMIDARESVGREKITHLANKAWRALVELQEECEAQGAPLAPNARLPEADE